MPQPLSTLSPPEEGLKIVSFTQDELSKRPELAAKVMRIIGIGSFIDHRLAEMIANFLKADFEAVTAMLSALSSIEGRRAAMKAAAKTVLSEDDYRLYAAVLKATTPPRKQRNKYAHHLWGTANYIPDGLLLIDPQDFARRDAKYAAEYRSHRDDLDTFLARRPPHTPMPKPPKMELFDYTKVMVYRKEDIDRDIEDALKAVELVSCLKLALSEHPVAAEMRSKLFAQPLIRQALEPKSTQNGK